MRNKYEAKKRKSVTGNDVGTHEKRLLGIMKIIFSKKKYKYGSLF